MTDRTQIRRSLTNPWVIGVALLLLSLAIHLAPPLNSMLNYQGGPWNPQNNFVADDYTAYNVQFHTDGNEELARRPLTTAAVNALREVGVPATWAFILPEFLLLLAVGVLIRLHARQLGLTEREAVAAQVLFGLLPTILFAFFPPLYSYDEPLNYALLIAALMAYVARRRWLFVLAFTFTLVARETTLILLPSLVYLEWKTQGFVRGQARRFVRSVWYMALPIAIYGIFIALYVPLKGIHRSPGQRPELVRQLDLFYLRFNFDGPARAAESLIFIFLAIGLPVFLLARYARRPESTARDRLWLNATVIALIFNTAVVLSAGKAREARLYLLPLLLVAPMLGRAWLSEMDHHGGVAGLIRRLGRWPQWLALTGLAAAAVVGTRGLFRLSIASPGENLFHEYLIVQTFLIGAFLIADAFARRHTTLPNPVADAR